MTHHPWRQLRHLTEWTVLFAALPSGMGGFCHWPTRTIYLRHDLTQAARRSHLTHELEHVERGPVAHRYTQTEEAVADQRAARKLIPLHALGEALAWSQHIHVVADELWTTPKMVRVRLAHLHPSEKHYLMRRLDDDAE